MPPSPPSARLISDAIAAQLLGTIKLYRGEIPTDDDPPLLPNSDRVAPYAIHYPYGPKNGPNDDLAYAGADVDYGCQISVVAGFELDCEAAAESVFNRLYGFVPTIANANCGMLLPPPGFDPGPVRIDRTIIPPRFSVPLQWRLVATAN